MSKPVMAICDGDRSYVHSLVSLFQKNKEFPFQIQGFTGVEALTRYGESAEIALLLISEKQYIESKRNYEAKHTLILRESTEYLTEIDSVEKYQSSGALYQAVMLQYAQYEDAVLFPTRRKQSYVMLGVYSPIHRCMQTTMALTMGQLLGRKRKTLYLNFECFSGLETIMGMRFGGNLTDLLYFYECNPEKLGYRMEGIIQHLGPLDLIPPALSYEEYENLSPEEWLQFFDELMRVGGYELLILDMTEGMRGLYHILEKCDRIFTLVGEDRMSGAKMAQYELLLEKKEQTGILEKTDKRSLPRFHNMPENLELLSRSELADYVQSMLWTDPVLKRLLSDETGR